MSESPIFKDRSKLSPRYLPAELPHREGQMNQLMHVFSESALNPDKFPLTVIQVIGSAGIGKSSTVIKFSKQLEENFSRNRNDLKTAYINLKLQGGNKFGIYKFLLERIAPELPSQGLGAEEMLRYLLRYLRQSARYILIILDEIDYLIKTSKDSSIIYDLTRLNEFDPDQPCNVKGVIFIARSTEFYNKLDEAEQSTLGRIPIEFPKYNINQVVDILDRRCTQAFNPKAMGSDVVDKVANITVSVEVNSDVRYALDLLQYAGNLAESQGEGRVTLDHVRKVHGKIHHSITSEEIEQLSKNHLLSLIALVRALRGSKKQYADLKEIRLYLAEAAGELKMKNIDVEGYLDDLNARKIIEIKSLREIGIHGASLSEIEPLLLRQIKRADK
jgi:archaeal cell division control protein 6